MKKIYITLMGVAYALVLLTVLNPAFNSTILSSFGVLWAIVVNLIFVLSIFVIAEDAKTGEVVMIVAGVILLACSCVLAAIVGFDSTLLYYTLPTSIGLIVAGLWFNVIKVSADSRKPANSDVSSGKLRPDLFDDGSMSDTEKIKEFKRKFSNKEFLVRLDDEELLKAEWAMLKAISRWEKLGLDNYSEEIQEVTVSLLKANYSSLLHLKHIYGLEGAKARLNGENGSELIQKGVKIYNSTTKDIDNFTDFIISVDKKEKDHEAEQARQAEIARKSDAELLLNNSIELL